MPDSTLQHALSDVVWIDRHDWSMIRATGADRIDLLNRISTNDLRPLRVDMGMQTVLVSEKARIVDILTLLNSADQTLIISSPGMASKVVSWIRKYIIMDDMKLADVTALWDFVEITGPRAAEAVAGMTSVDVADLPMFGWRRVDVEDGELIVVRMQTMSELSYWLCGSRPVMQVIREQLRASSQLIPELEHGDVENLRIHAGMGKVGNEWSEAYNPLEAGLLHLTSFTKGCYIGQEVIARLDSYNKVKQRIMGISSSDPINTGDAIYFDEKEVGRITSTYRNDATNATIGLAYIRGEHGHDNLGVVVRSETTDTTATMHALPLAWQ